MNSTSWSRINLKPKCTICVRVPFCMRQCAECGENGINLKAKCTVCVAVPFRLRQCASVAKSDRPVTSRLRVHRAVVEHESLTDAPVTLLGPLLVCTGTLQEFVAELDRWRAYLRVRSVHCLAVPATHNGAQAGNTKSNFCFWSLKFPDQKNSAFDSLVSFFLEIGIQKPRSSTSSLFSAKSGEID